MTKKEYLSRFDLSRPNTSVRQMAEMLALKDEIIETLELTVAALRQRVNELTTQVEEQIEKQLD